MTGAEDRPAGAESDAFQRLPDRISLADTSTTHDTSAADAYGSLGSISAHSPLNIPIGPEGGDGD